MAKPARFQFDPRLAVVLGESYRSSEQALKELVDNAWDADAETVHITLPAPLSKDPIVVEDDGTGMTEREVRSEYLKVASDRRIKKGDRTPRLKRLVKGRKGIGKFAGLMAASAMRLVTRARGAETELPISKDDLLRSARDLENIDLPIASLPCDEKAHGTTITLSQLNQLLEFPKPERLREILVLEYGRETDFTVYVNGEPLAVEHVPGDQLKQEVEVPGVGAVKLNVTIVEPRKALKHPGIVVRVGGKVVGSPSFFGLDEDDDIPSKLLKRVYGEIDADGLADDVTADWGAIIENSMGMIGVSAAVRDLVRQKVQQVFRGDLKQARTKREAIIREGLERLPEHRRRLAEAALNRALKRFYGESEDRIDTVVSVMLDSFEHDEYWSVIQAIENARQSDVARFAEALSDFGLLDMAVVAEQGRGRLAVLDALDDLIARPETVEKDLHSVIERNLWLFDDRFTLMSSNKTLGKVLETWLDDESRRRRGKKRPDLLLCDSIHGGQLLVEFKEPRHAITRDDETQATKYRDDLRRQFSKIEVVVVGAGRAASVDSNTTMPGMTVLSYAELLSAARSRIEWLVSHLKHEE